MFCCSTKFAKIRTPTGSALVGVLIRLIMLSHLPTCNQGGYYGLTTGTWLVSPPIKLESKGTQHSGATECSLSGFLMEIQLLSLENPSKRADIPPLNVAINRPVSTGLSRQAVLSQAVAVGTSGNGKQFPLRGMTWWSK